MVYFLLLSPVHDRPRRDGAWAEPSSRPSLYIWTHGRMEPGPLWFCEALLIFAGLYLAAARRHAGPRAPGPAVFPFQRDACAGRTRHGRRRVPVAPRLADRDDAHPSAARLFRELRRFVRGRMPRGALAEPRRGAGAAAAAVDLGRRSDLPADADRVCARPDASRGSRRSQSGGWNLQAAVYALWEPFLAWGVIMGLLHLATRRIRERPAPVAIAVAPRLCDLHHPSARPGRARARLALRRRAAGAEIPC